MSNMGYHMCPFLLLAVLKHACCEVET